MVSLHNELVSFTARLQLCVNHSPASPQTSLGIHGRISTFNGSFLPFGTGEAAQLLRALLLSLNLGLSTHTVTRKHLSLQFQGFACRLLLLATPATLVVHRCICRQNTRTCDNENSLHFLSEHERSADLCSLHRRG